MEGYQTAKWDGGTRAITACCSAFPQGDQILTEQSLIIYTVFPLLLLTDDTSRCISVFAGWFIWILIGIIWVRATDVRAKPSYLTLGSSEGTEEEQEPLDMSLASSCSPGPAVANAPFDVIHLRGLPLIMSASGTPWPPPTLHTDDPR